PSAAELLGASIVELGLKIFEAAEGLLDDFGNRAGGITAALGLHDLPEHSVIGVASAVVADRSANVFGNGIQVSEQVFDTLGQQLGMLLQRGIQILDVGAVMHVVVELHGFLVNIGFECGVFVWQGWQFMHRYFLLHFGNDDGNGVMDSLYR